MGIWSDLKADTSGFGDVTGPASAVDGNFASFNGTSGKIIQDSGVSASSFFQVANNLSEGTPATMRSNLGLVIGTNVQAYDATLQSLSALGTAANRFAYTTGVDTWAEDQYVPNSTFTPTLEFGGGSTGITYSSQEGQYQRIGNMVFIRIQLVLTSKGTDTGSATITGLPYTASDVGAMSIRFQNMGFGGHPMARVTGSTVYLEEVTSGAALTAITDADFANDTLYQVTGFYFVA